MIVLTPDTWLISDTHWKHKNIVEFCDRPADADARMIVNWRRRVRPNDQVLHLGDLALALGQSWTYYETFLQALPGRKFLLRGNHDRASASVYRSLGFDVLDLRRLPLAPTTDSQIKTTRVLRQVVLGRRLALSHVPLQHDGSWDVNLHGHIHNLIQMPDQRWVNVSVEVRRYRPVRLSSLIRIPAR